MRTGFYFSLGLPFLVSDRKYSAPSLELFQISDFAVRIQRVYRFRGMIRHGKCISKRIRTEEKEC